MIDVIPAILSQNYEDLKNKIALVRGIVPVVQIDLCDGIFVQNKTWPFSTGGANDFNFQKILNEEEGMPFWEDIDFELDLMVADAVENFDIYTKLSPKRIVFHLEAVGNLEEFKHFLEGMDVYIRDAIQMGLAINTATPVEQIFPLINHVDFVQCMGIEKIGFQGQDFDERVLSQIKSLKEKFPDLIISVDGGVSLKTAPALVGAGATRLVAGNAILKSQNIRETISELEELG
jgi:ribulose-phosphate 3-epimerase